MFPLVPVIPPIPLIEFYYEEPITTQEFKILQEINDFRLENNLNTTVVHHKVCALAKARLYEIDRSFDHGGFYILAGSFLTNGKAYENLAKNYKYDKVVSAWKSSKTHLENLLKPMRHLCVKGAGNLWVMEGYNPE